MTCPRCRRQLDRGAAFCPSCGGSRTGSDPVFELVLADRSRVPLVGEVSIGRAPGNDVQLVDPAVSRVHARIVVTEPGGFPVLRDVGSSHGVWVDGRRLDTSVPLHDGARIDIGDQALVVERRREDAEAGSTLVVPAGATASGLGTHPRLRSGYALKRMDVTEGSRRWLLKDLVGHQVVRLGDADAGLLGMVDGEHSIADLVRESERSIGPAGPARLARLLSDVGARGLLAGSPERPRAEVGLARLTPHLRERRATWASAGELVERVYLGGAWVLFTRPVLAVLAAVAALGIAVFAYLVGAGAATPFVVADSLGLGGVVFVLGRLAVAAVHESAHALTLASYGRRVGAAGIKLVLVFPYTFVDTSDAWFEPRRRRIAVSAAGPAADLVVGGSCAIGCLLAPSGTGGDILFQLAFGAYYGALFNLNPLLDRDGYQILVDVLGRPGLRRRALGQLRERIAGRTHASASRLLDRYALCVLLWMVIVASVAVALLVRYEPRLAAVAPEPAAWALVVVIGAGLLVPPLLVVGPPLRERLQGRRR